MSKIQFYFNCSVTTIQCNKNDLMEDICKKFSIKVSVDMNSIYFIYNGNIVNLKLKYSDIINQYDKERNAMSIMVIETNENNINENGKIIKANYPICQICKENTRIQIKDYKINIFGCKNNHTINSINLDEYENSQKIDLSKINCDVCKLNNKSKTFNNQLYICISCSKNLCPLCKDNHDKNHNIINYELKDFTCKVHNELYYSYCVKCNENLCILCEKNHNNHSIVPYGKIIPNEKELKNKLDNAKETINLFSKNINEIINKLIKVKNTIEFIYNINNEFLNNYNIKNRNYQVLQNINDINDNLAINDLIQINEDNDAMNKIKKIIDIYNKINFNNSANYNKENYLEDSLIIQDKNDSKIIKNWISPNKEIAFKLLYRATRDGDSYKDFHSKCNDAPNISFIKTNDGKIIGGYTTIPWKCESISYISDKDAFIFSMDSKEKYEVKKEYISNAIYHDESNYCCCYGYCGDDLAIHEKFLNNNNSYCCGNGDHYWSFNTDNLKMIGKDVKDKVKLIISELEVYKVCINEIESFKNCPNVKSENQTKSVNVENNQTMIDSLIIKDKHIVKMLKNWISPNDIINFELLFRATRDGDSSNAFHLKCDNNSPTISIIKTENGKIIGGYTTIPWIKEDKSFISDENTFIFSVDSKEKK